MHLSGTIFSERGYICAVGYPCITVLFRFSYQINRIGNLLGEGKARRAGLVARTSIFMGMAMAGILWYVAIAAFCLDVKPV